MPEIEDIRAKIKGLRRQTRRRVLAAYGNTPTEVTIDEASVYIMKKRVGRSYWSADTDSEAAENAYEGSVSLGLAILSSIASSPAGDQELATRIGRKKLSVGAARNDLMENALVEDSGVRRSTGGGMEIVWKVTRLGQAVVDNA